MLPIMVVDALLFVVLAITTKEERKNQFEFNSSRVLAYCASLFFVLIIFLTPLSGIKFQLTVSSTLNIFAL